jgi:hypothetical protein
MPASHQLVSGANVPPGGCGSNACLGGRGLCGVVPISVYRAQGVEQVSMVTGRFIAQGGRFWSYPTVCPHRPEAPDGPQELGRGEDARRLRGEDAQEPELLLGELDGARRTP